MDKKTNDIPDCFKKPINYIPDEEFLRKAYTAFIASQDEETFIYNCKNAGLIKQSREDELRKMIKNYEYVTTDIVRELVSILDKRLEDK